MYMYNALVQSVARYFTDAAYTSRTMLAVYMATMSRKTVGANVSSVAAYTELKSTPADTSHSVSRLNTTANSDPCFSASTIFDIMERTSDRLALDPIPTTTPATARELLYCVVIL